MPEYYSQDLQGSPSKRLDLKGEDKEGEYEAISCERAGKRFLRCIDIIYFWLDSLRDIVSK